MPSVVVACFLVTGLHLGSGLRASAGGAPLEKPGPASDAAAPAGAGAPDAAGKRPRPFGTATERREESRKLRVAVLIVATGGVDAELADNLTEVLIVSLAGRGLYQVVGKEAVRGQIGETEKEVLRCINNRTCVGNVSTALALDSLLVGTLGKFEDLWLYNLYFLEASSAAERKRVHRRVAGDLGALTKSLEAALVELLKPRVKPGAVRLQANVPGAKVHIDDEFAGTVPLFRGDLKPGAIRLRVEAGGYFPAEREVRVVEGKTLRITVRLVPVEPRTKTWKFHLAWTTSGAAAGFALVAAVTGALSRRSRSDTQVEAWQDVERRRILATTANAMWALAGLSAVTSAVIFGVFHRGFHRGGASERPSREPFFQVLPVEGGGAVQGGFRW